MNTNPDVPDLINFDLYFPNLMDTMKNYSKLVDHDKVQADQFLAKMAECILPKFSGELEDKIPNDYWKTLSSWRDAEISKHTTNVLFCLVGEGQNAEYQAMNKYHQNICKWAALLHDICKRGMPMFAGADHIHAFASGAALFKIFRHFGIFKIEGEE